MLCIIWAPGKASILALTLVTPVLYQFYSLMISAKGFIGEYTVMGVFISRHKFLYCGNDRLQSVNNDLYKICEPKYLEIFTRILFSD